MGFVVSSTYTYHTPSGYIFRLRIPKDLQRIVGKTEFRYSLRSGFLREAKVRAQAIAHYIHGLFEKVRHNMTAFTKDISATVENAASLNRVKPSTPSGTRSQPSGNGRRCMSQFLLLCSAIVQEESPIHDTVKGMRSISFQK